MANVSGVSFISEAKEQFFTMLDKELVFGQYNNVYKHCYDLYSYIYCYDPMYDTVLHASCFNF